MNAIIDHLVELLQTVDSGYKDFPIKAQSEFFLKFDENTKNVFLIPRIQSVTPDSNNTQYCLRKDVRFSVSIVVPEGSPDSYKKLYTTYDSLSDKYSEWFSNEDSLLAGWLVKDLLLDSPNGIQVLNTGDRNGLMLEVFFTLKYHKS